MKIFVEQLAKTLSAYEFTYTEGIYLIAIICSQTRLTDALQNVTATVEKETDSKQPSSKKQSKSH